MQPGPYEKVPLTDDEKDVLLYIYQYRLRFFIAVYFSLMAMAAFTVINPFRDYLKTLNFLEVVSTIFLLEAIPFLGIIGTGIYLFFRKIVPYKHDVDSGVKEKIPFTIIRREYFPLTNQFFVGLDDPDYLHHEITEDMYYKCSEGDTIYLYRGCKSKYIFEEDGRFSII